MVAFRAEILRASVERGLECCVFTVLGCVEVDLSLSLEHPRHRIARAKISAEARELMPNFSDCAIRIIGERKNQNRDAAGSVTFVRALAVLDALTLARSF